MPRPRHFDVDVITRALTRRGGVATHQDLMRIGVPRSTIIRWAEHGPWQRLLPGVVLAHRGRPTTQERRLAALAFCGPHGVISGTHALDLHGVTRDRIDADAEVLVLIPHQEQRTSNSFVIVERTTRLPLSRLRSGVPVAPVARAAADAGRYARADVDRVREIFGAVVQTGRCTVEELVDEVYAGPRQRTATARRVLREVSIGTASAAEGRALEMISGADVPQPVWNEDVVVNGEFIGNADAWWPHLRVALEIDGMRWHSSPLAIRRTQEKQRRYAAAGILLITIAPADILDDPAGFLAIVERTLRRAAHRVAG